jgi:hypothetical protein
MIRLLYKGNNQPQGFLIIFLTQVAALTQYYMLYYSKAFSIVFVMIYLVYVLKPLIYGQSNNGKLE